MTLELVSAPELANDNGNTTVLVKVPLTDALLWTVEVEVWSWDIVSVEYTVYVGETSLLTKLELSDSVNAVLTAEYSVLYGTLVPDTSTVATAVVVVP
jgi:hypothetical protein